MYHYSVYFALVYNLWVGICNQTTNGCVHKTFSSQSSTMSYRKLFTKIYTAVILLSFIMADPNNDIALAKPGMDGIRSFTFRFIPDHSEREFDFMAVKMNRFFSRCDMPVDDFNGIFRDETTRTHIKEDSYDTLNNWYSNEIMRRSVNDPATAEGQILLDNIKKIPLYYMYKTEDYAIVTNSDDIAECLDYYWSENNLSPQVKNWGYFASIKKTDMEFFLKIHRVFIRVRD